MRSILFFIPHDIAGVPLFGVGALLALLACGLIAWIGWGIARKRPLHELLAGLPIWIIAGAIVTIVLPGIEQKVEGRPIGLPIRGYGVMVLLGLVGGIAISALRGRRLGIHPDTVIGLGFWMMLGGVLGARIFYVVQKWEEFSGRMFDIVKLTEGGLVIYGGVIGGLIAGAIFCHRNQLKILATADLVAPGFMLGLALGRIGCLLHGCCFGGVCTAQLPAIQFPHGSVPYQAQLANGQMLGLELSGSEGQSSTITQMQPGGIASDSGLKVGDVVSLHVATLEPKLKDEPTAPPKVVADIRAASGQQLAFFPEDLPNASLPVHPSQIYAAINAALLCLFLWHFQPLPSRDGVVFCIGIILYALSRFLLEGVRSDEQGQLGTPFTIAQLVAIGSTLAAAGGLAILNCRPAGRSWNWRKPAE